MGEGVEYSNPGPLGFDSPLYIDCLLPAKASTSGGGKAKRMKILQKEAFGDWQNMQTGLPVTFSK